VNLGPGFVSRRMWLNTVVSIPLQRRWSSTEHHRSVCLCQKSASGRGYYSGYNRKFSHCLSYNFVPGKKSQNIKIYLRNIVQ